LALQAGNHPCLSNMGWPGNDTLSPGKAGKRDEVYCGKGKDVVEVGSAADKIDYVDDSCEIKEEVSLIVP
jgi:hypothetical protein